MQTNAEHRIELRSRDHSFVPPCQAACPLRMDIREYVDLVAQGRIMEALQVIRGGNPFPSICAYVCTHPCEESCRRSQVDKPIAIRSLKRFALEFGGDRMVQVEARTEHSEKVAIVGSGPAGMACAYYLRNLGYPATIFEAHSEIGGMLRVGIPRYRLPREVLDVEIQRLTKMGVEIRTDTRVVSLDLLFDMGYKAVFVTIGAHQSLRMGIEGEDSPGVIDGATFLREVNLGLKPSLGNGIAVVGGGNVAIDAARTALRLGSRKVTILYRRSQTEMPADPAEVAQALEEGVHIEFLVSPTKIRRQDGKLNTTCVRMELGEPDASGRPRPIPIEGSEFTLRIDSVIAAVGQRPDLSFVPEDSDISINRWSCFELAGGSKSQTTNVRFFAGGDAVAGPETVIKAIAAGQQAAEDIDKTIRSINGEPPYEAPPEEKIDIPLVIDEETQECPQVRMPLLDASQRKGRFVEVELGFSREDAIKEAIRCLRCDAEK